MEQSDSKNKSSRKRLYVDLGDYHDEWLQISEKFNVKPSSFAAALIKNTIDEIKQQNENISFKLDDLAEHIQEKKRDVLRCACKRLIIQPFF